MLNLSADSDLSLDFGYPKQMRLRKSDDYKTVYTRGKRYFTAHFIVYILPRINESGVAKPLRTGIAVSKKVGVAVRRNRIKRLLREFFRLHYKLLPQADVAVVAKKQTLFDLSFSQVEVELGSLFAQITKLS